MLLDTVSKYVLKEKKSTTICGNHLITTTNLLDIHGLTSTTGRGLQLPVGVVGRLDVLGRNDVEGQDSVGSAIVHFGLVPDATWWDTEQHDIISVPSF